ncbi:MAG: hypothetical protein DCF16_05295 [Alphaproteobacteria bacterium]|nr:MAG: hypothetical protein DCF16_05295 [Alphaproteobacteria bacterium]
MNGERTFQTAVIRFALAGLATTIVLLALDSAGVGRAVREFFLQSYQWSRAYDEGPTGIDESFLMVSFDEDYCVTRHYSARLTQLSVSTPGSRSAIGDRTCLVKEPPSRRDIARAIQTLAQSTVPAGALVVDVNFVPQGCDADTLAVTSALIAAARRTAVFLVRPLTGAPSALVSEETIFGACEASLAAEDVEYLRGDPRIYFGWSFFERAPRRGFSEYMRVWRQVETDAGAPLMPSLPFLLAAYRHNPEQLTAMEQGNFLIREREPPQNRDTIQEVRVCEADRAQCRWAVSPELTAGPRVRISYRLPPPALQDPSQPRRWPAVIQEIGAHYLQRQTIEEFVLSGLGSEPIVIVGATAASYQDLHITPIGSMPGSLVIANAYLDLRDASGLVERPFFQLIVEELATLFATTLVIIVILALVWRFHARSRSPKLWTWDPKIAWPLVVLLVTSAAAWFYWRIFGSDIRNGVFSFAILSALAAGFEVLRTCYDATAPHIVGGVQRGVNWLGKRNSGWFNRKNSTERER